MDKTLNILRVMVFIALIIVIINMVCTAVNLGIDIRVSEIVRNNPKTYLDGVEVSIESVNIRDYKYDYDEENNILRLTQKSSGTSVVPVPVFIPIDN